MQLTSQPAPQNDTQHAAWIAGRVLTLLKHYYSPETSPELQDAMIDDWVEMLTPFSQAAIERACHGYMRDQPRRRPTPGDIRSRCREERKQPEMGQGNRAELTHDELALLDEKVLPKAKEWLMVPGLAQHGRKTLEFWGESV